MNQCTETTIDISGETYPVSIIRKNYSRLSLKIRFSLRVFVSCPNHVSDEEAIAFMHANMDWLEINMSKIQWKLSLFPLREMMAGKKILWFGEVLPVVKNEELSVPFKFFNGKLYVPESYYESLREIENYAKSIVTEKYQIILSKMVSDTQSVLPLSFRLMSGSWGSCNVKTRHINLNSRLYYLPIGLVTYVIIHEVLHFHYPNHGVDFHRRLEKYVPNHRKLERQLKNYDVLLY